ncbi:sushi domain-containing protein 2 isoform X1 [Anguilla anguilla]|uniref:sushi domain-containing protein 2 isoform X1 n=2 Tax=Anguilla anguilla TaxID=7936 RepID=UPI0015A8BA04|nr:sushi domain-containing protein 2 isoform X1 [Anguilla anguilla]
MWIEVIFILLCTSKIYAQTCAGQCGQKWETCSCHTTCASLQNCCPDYRQFCLEISPYSGGMFGGSDFTLLGVTFDQTSKIFCRFNGEIVVDGYVDGDGRGHCISPFLYETGWISFDISTDDVTYNRHGSWLSVHPGKLSPDLKATLVNATQWQYYGTPNVAGTLKLTWNTSLIKADKVKVELWGYREIGEPYSSSWTPEWKYLYTLGRDLPNDGQFSFIPKPQEKPVSEWELGSVRVSSSSEPDGRRDVEAVWSDDHALAWHLEERFRRDSASWALGKCLSWDTLERALPNFLNETIDCPCTLTQARADTGRFHTDYGCDIEKGSVCTYHPGSVHCVRAIQASPKYGAGQQCCYDSTGAQVLTADSIGGSTPDRGHDWGSPPYRKPPRVPGLSHWVYDVLSFYYCCLWSDNCHYYFTHRPSSDCRTYQAPKAGFAFGDPHFVTFDGSSYTFNGKGEYYLVLAPGKGLTIQGRTEPVKLENGTLANATRLSSVAMQENTSDVIEVRLAVQEDRLEVLKNQEVLSFSQQSWMDLKGVFVFSSVPQNVTVMFPTGAGVEVRARGGTMATTVLLPQEFDNQTLGLLGRMNDDPGDDLVSSDGEVVPLNQTTAEALFKFGAGWAIANETSLFTYDTARLLDEYYFTPKHDPAFVPAFSFRDDPDDPLYGEVSKMCSGPGSWFCKYDALTSRSLRMGNSTMVSFTSHSAVMRDLEPVVSCGWLAPPRNGRKEGTRYLEGSKVTFSCNKGYVLSGSGERTCQGDGAWSGETTHCVSDNILGIVLGSVFALLGLIGMIVAVILTVRKQKRKAPEIQLKGDI